ncbi:hypothetical protein Moror_5248 [Moniliophthora roreri MCA 2997]|uniref:Uncharacterized protein n=1 Tax=Moniliophthora roreri (strain MCA 2997) TaxID=1381753 RepID=V2WQQ7_MONRO|nr:hypothetical protein Moror_5248 [Moniliophthora roreri MCA 2997]
MLAVLATAILMTPGTRAFLLPSARVEVELDKATAEAFVLAQAGSFAVGLKTFCLSLAIRYMVGYALIGATAYHHFSIRNRCLALCSLRLSSGVVKICLIQRKYISMKDVTLITKHSRSYLLAITTCRGSDDISRYGKIAIGYWRTLFCDSHQFSANASPMYADASRALTRISQPAHFDLKFYGAKYLDATFAPVGLLGEGGKVSRVARQLVRLTSLQMEKLLKSDGLG